MAHRASNDAYSRRPSSDDRRASDTYDRRRGGFGRSGSDNFYRDRERERERDRDRDWDRDRDRERDRDRDRDRSDRDRDRDRDKDRDDDQRRDVPTSPRDKDSSRERPPPPDPPRGPKAMSITSASSDLGASRIRQDRHGSAGSSPMSPALGMNIDSSNAAEAISKVFRSWIDDVSEFSRLQIHRENLDRAIKVREAEFAKASSKHSDFPSVPELHKKFLSRDRQQLKEVDEKIKKHHHRAVKTASQMAQLLLTALPLVEMKKSVKETDAVCQKGELDAFREEFKDLRSQFVKFQETSTQERAALQEQVKDLQAELAHSKVENEALQKKLKETETDLGGLKRACDVEVSGLQSQLAVVRAHQVREQDIAGETAKLAACNTQLLAKNDELEKQIAVVQSERCQLQLRLSNLEAAHESMNETVKAAQQESLITAAKLQAGLESSNFHSLKEMLARQESRLAPLERTLTSVEQKLIDLDFSALDEISQNWTFEWPDMKKAVRDIQKELVQRRQLSQHPEAHGSPVHPIVEHGGQADKGTVPVAEASRQVSEDILAEVNKAVTAKLTSFTNVVIGMVEKLEETAKNTRKEVSELSARLKSIEELKTGGRLAALEGNIEQVKILEGKVEQIEILRGKIGQIESKFDPLKTEFTDKTDALDHQVSALMMQFDNLSTEELAVRIIGHLEQLMPNPQQLATDMTVLDTKLELIQKQIQDISTRSYYKEAHAKEVDELDDAGKGWQTQYHKRRRLDSNANGVLQQPVTNSGG